ncbi:V-set domain-containing T-cell activation inhibitor 1-like [Aplochiton taeniatus]
MRAPYCVCLSSAESLLALVGDDVILPCVLKPNVSALDQVVEWTRPILGTRSLHFYRDGRDSLQDQHATYRGRTAMFIEEMKMGNVSVKLSRARLSDAGQFKCYLPKYNRQESWVTLDVGAVSQPVISIRGTTDGGVALHCESGGWYPEPEVEWLDSEGHVLSAGPTERVNDTDGTFTVRRNVTVYQTDTNRFTCRVQQQHINQTRETEIYVPGEVFQSRLPVSRSTTKHCVRARGQVEGKEVCLVDTPGLFTSKFSEEEIMRSIEFSAPGPHLFLLVLPAVRYSYEEKDLVQTIQKTFGPAAARFSMLLFTHRDQLDGRSMDEVLSENPELRALVEACGGHYHLFNNKRADPTQVTELMRKVDKMVDQQVYYTLEMWETGKQGGR